MIKVDIEEGISWFINGKCDDGDINLSIHVEHNWIVCLEAVSQ